MKYKHKVALAAIVAFVAVCSAVVVYWSALSAILSAPPTVTVNYEQSNAASSTTITAASCSQSDVQAALNSVTAATTQVSIPSGNCAWTAQTTFTVPSGNTNLAIVGATSCTGADGPPCTDGTIITDNDTADSNYLLEIGTGPASSYFTLKGITFDSGTGTEKQNGLILFGGGTRNLRLTQLHLNDNTGSSGEILNIRLTGWIYGVEDHSLLDGNTGISVYMDQYGTLGTANYGDNSWAAPTDFGSADAFFIENNTFNAAAYTSQSAAYIGDCYEGGRQVIRYNVINNAGIDLHPTGGAERWRGCRSTEIYMNTMNGNNSAGAPTFTGFFQSSGPALVWGNTLGNGYESLIWLVSARNGYDYAQVAAPNGWGYCSASAINGIAGPSAWDENSSGANGYACLDQPGRGQSDLLNGQWFPNALDTVTGKASWPNQKLEPVYEWLDKWQPTSYAPGRAMVSLAVSTEDATTFEQNRDWYQYTQTWNGSSWTGTAFNGTVGTGSGLLSARPTTCTSGVAYWATDTNTLYQCTATNTWTAYYTPYTYPYPLDNSSGSGSGTPAPTPTPTPTSTPDTTPPSVPTNLAAAAVSTSQINLSWTASTDNVGVTGYNVYRNGTKVGTASTNSYSSTGLAASTAYSYTVSAYDATGNTSAQSSAASATTQAAAAPPVTTSGSSALVQQAGTTAEYNGSTYSSDSVQFPGNTQSGDTIIVGLQYGGAATQAISCSDPNDPASTYHIAANGLNSYEDIDMAILYSSNIVGGTTPKVTCTIPGGSSFVSMAIHEYSGLAASGALDVTSSYSSASAKATSLTTGAATTHANGELVFGAFIANRGSNDGYTAGSGFTMRINQGTSAPSGYADEDGTQATAGSIAASMSLSPADYYFGAVVTFKTSSGTGTTTPTSTPTVSIVAPSSGATVSGMTSVSANAADSAGITAVQFSVDNVPEATDTASPYTWNWNTAAFSNGAHTVTAKVTGKGGTTASASVAVTTNNAATSTGTISLAQSATSITFYTGTTGTISVPFGSAVKAGDFLIVDIGNEVGGPINTTGTISDKLGNTFVLATSTFCNVVCGYKATGNIIYYVANSKGGADTITWTWTIGVLRPAVAVFEYSGIATTNPVDTMAASGGVALTSLSTGNITTSNANDLLFSSLITYGASTSTAATTVGSGWTKGTNSFDGQVGNSYLFTSSRIVSSASTYSNAFGGFPSTAAVASIVAFKAAP